MNMHERFAATELMVSGAGAAITALLARIATGQARLMGEDLHRPANFRGAAVPSAVQGYCGSAPWLSRQVEPRHPSAGEKLVP
jgi:hypothetical protein